MHDNPSANRFLYGFSTLLINLAAFILFTCGVASAVTTGTVAGFVSDKSGNVLVGASLVIEGTPFGSMTDMNGEYYIPRLSPGVYSVTARMVGMGAVTKEGITVLSGQITRIDFTLENFSNK